MDTGFVQSLRNYINNGYSINDWVKEAPRHYLKAFIIEVFIEDSEKLRSIFPQSKNITSTELGRWELESLPPKSIDDISEIIFEILKSTYAKGDDSMLTENILTFVSNSKTGLLPEHFEHLLNIPTLTESQEVYLYTCFSNVAPFKAYKSILFNNPKIFEKPYLVSTWLFLISVTNSPIYALTKYFSETKINEKFILQHIEELEILLEQLLEDALDSSNDFLQLYAILSERKDHTKIKMFRNVVAELLEVYKDDDRVILLQRILSNNYEFGEIQFPKDNSLTSGSRLYVIKKLDEILFAPEPFRYYLELFDTPSFKVHITLFLTILIDTLRVVSRILETLQGSDRVLFNKKRLENSVLTRILVHYYEWNNSLIMEFLAHNHMELDLANERINVYQDSDYHGIPEYINLVFDYDKPKEEKLNKVVLAPQAFKQETITLHATVNLVPEDEEILTLIEI